MDFWRLAVLAEIRFFLTALSIAETVFLRLPAVLFLVKADMDCLTFFLIFRLTILFLLLDLRAFLADFVIGTVKS